MAYLYTSVSSYLILYFESCLFIYCLSIYGNRNSYEFGKIITDKKYDIFLLVTTCILQQSILLFLWARYLSLTIYGDKVLYCFFIIYDHYL